MASFTLDICPILFLTTLFLFDKKYPGQSVQMALRISLVSDKRPEELVS